MKFMKWTGMVFIIIVATAINSIITDELLLYAEQIMQIPNLYGVLPFILMLYMSGLTYIIFTACYFISGNDDVKIIKRYRLLFLRLSTSILLLLIFPLLYVGIFIWIYYKEFIKDDFPAMNLVFRKNKEMRADILNLLTRESSEGAIFCVYSLGIATVLTIMTIVNTILEGMNIFANLQKSYLAFCRLTNHYSRWCMGFLLNLLIMHTVLDYRNFYISVHNLTVKLYGQRGFTVVFALLSIPVLQNTVWHWRWERKYKDKLQNNEVAPGIDTVPFP